MNARRARAFIFCTVTLDVLALGLMIPVLPRIVLEFMGGDTAGAAEMFGLFSTVWALMQFLCSPLLGVLSDRYGRRPVLLISCLGLGLDYVFMAVAPSLTLLFIGRIVSGIASATISTGFAYMADITPEEDRARAFGVIGVAFGLGFVVGPAIGGLLGSLDPRLPLWAAAGACFLNAAFGWFVLPESLPPGRRMAFAWKRANPIGAFRLLANQRQLVGLAAANFLVELANKVMPSVFVLYATYRYGWTETNVGLTLALVGICAAIVQGALVGPMVARLGERRTLALALACGALGMVAYGLAPDGGWFLLGVPLMCMGTLSGPSIMGLMSRLIGPSEQGQLQGANTSLSSVAGLFGPGLFTLTFSALLTQRPGAAFDLAGAILLAALVVAWLATRTPPAAGPAR
jgi:DHA1 family tetracycline resistance protein-like MFS transporter